MLLANVRVCARSDGGGHLVKGGDLVEIVGLGDGEIVVEAKLVHLLHVVLDGDVDDLAILDVAPLKRQIVPRTTIDTKPIGLEDDVGGSRTPTKRELAPAPADQRDTPDRDVAVALVGVLGPDHDGDVAHDDRQSKRQEDRRHGEVFDRREAHFER